LKPNLLQKGDEPKEKKMECSNQVRPTCFLVFKTPRTTI
jgi:hypothetical protein